MRILTLFIILFFINFSLFAQEPTLKFSGFIKDSTTKEPIEFATVQLIRYKDSLKTGNLTNEKGEFSIEKIPFGKYSLKISAGGFQKLIIDSLKFFPESKDILSQSFFLSSKELTTKEVEIIADKENFQTGLEKQVFNVDKNLINPGGSAVDVLQTIPSVSVDIDGKVSMRGSENLIVLIDGKPSGLTGVNRQAALSGIPTNSIERIELIPNPSAKYDPDGMAGIINIVLKKNMKDGFNGNLTTSVGTGHKYTSNALFNYRTSKFNLGLNYNYSYNRNFFGGYQDRKNYFNDSTYNLNNDTKGYRQAGTHLAKLNFDFFLSPKTTIYASGTYNFNWGNKHQQYDYEQYTENNPIKYLYDRNQKMLENGDNYEASAGMKHNYTKPGHEWSIDASLSKRKNNIWDNFETHNVDFSTFSRPFQNTLTKNNFLIGAAQTDYILPLGEKIKLEMGLKFAMRDLTALFDSKNLDLISNEYVFDPTISNEFNYDEKIYSAYGIYNQIVKSWKFQFGLRLEQTDIKVTQITNNEVYKNPYFNPFPSLNIGKKFEKIGDFRLGLSRRINRPDPGSLNPFTEFNDPFNLMYGNPRLKPEYVYNADLGYNKSIKKSILTASIYYRYTTDKMTRFRVIDSTGVSRVTFANIDNAIAIGTDWTLKTEIGKWLSLVFNANLYYSQVNAGNLQENLVNNNVTLIGKMIANFKIMKGLDAQLLFNYMGPQAFPQGTMAHNQGFDLGIKKEFAKGKWFVNLSLSDVLNTRRFLINSEGTNFNSEVYRKRETRILTLSLAYKFGKETGNMFKRKSIIQNEGGSGREE